MMSQQFRAASRLSRATPCNADAANALEDAVKHID